MEYPSEEARMAVEQAGYAGTRFENFITFIKRYDKKAGADRFNPYMTVDGRVLLAKEESGDKPFGIYTFFNTNELDKQLAAVIGVASINIIIPGKSCVAVFVDHKGGIHFGTASIGSTGMVDQTNPLENAETSAAGRALGLAGYGLIPGTAGIASAEEVVGAIQRGAATQQQDGEANLSMAELGQQKIKDGGFGKEHKFPGWTFKDVYDDGDGYGLLQWAANQDSPTGAVAMMARYFALREEAGGNTEEGQAITGDIVQIAGRNVSADELLGPEWTKWVQRLVTSNIGDDKPFGHANHVVNHLKKWYGVAKVMDLTGRKAAGFVRFLQSGGKDKDPSVYGDDVEDLFGPESLDDLLKQAKTNLPPPYDDVPDRWLDEIYGKYAVDVAVMNAKQVASMRKILGLVASGTIPTLCLHPESPDVEDPMFGVFDASMKKVSGDAG